MLVKVIFSKRDIAECASFCFTVAYFLAFSVEGGGCWSLATGFIGV